MGAMRSSKTIPLLLLLLALAFVVLLPVPAGARRHEMKLTADEVHWHTLHTRVKYPI